MTNTGIFVGVTKESVDAVSMLLLAILSSQNADAVKISALETMTKVLKVGYTTISGNSINMGVNETSCST